MHIYIIISFILVILLYLWMICPNLGRTSAMDKYNHALFAHRGLYHEQLMIPENSIPAYKKAIKAGLAIEIDIHITKDKQVVVFHDNDLMRICNSPLVIEESTYQQLKEHRLSGTTEQIPLLSDVLALVGGQVPLLIELKLPSHSTQLCQIAARILDQYTGAYLIQSFNPLGIRWFQKNRPQILRGQLSSRLTKDKDPAPFIFRFFVEHLLSNFYCRPDFVSYKYSDTHHLGLFIIRHLFHAPVAVWTLDEASDFTKAREQFHMVIFEKLPMKFINIL